MWQGKFSTPKQIVAISIVAFFGFFFLADKLFVSEPYFPDLPSGAYVGQISGLGSGGDATIYAERLDGINALLLVIFRHGWKPRIHSLSPMPSEEARSRIQWQPLKLSSGEETFSMTGRTQGESFEGTIAQSDTAKGTWSLAKIDSKELRKNALADSPSFNLISWLQQKGVYRASKQEEEQLDSSIQNWNEKLTKLQAYIAEGDELRARAKTRRTALESDIAILKKTKREKLGELKQYVREIDQLNRITRKGQTIELARRVSKRENKWYLVHWQQGMDLSALEETLAVSLNVDLRKLNVQVERAKEIDSLKHAISLEKSRIRKLKKQYKEKIQGPSKTKPKKDSGDDTPWWNRWDTVFG